MCMGQNMLTTAKQETDATERICGVYDVGRVSYSRLYVNFIYTQGRLWGGGFMVRSHHWVFRGEINV